jgi:hypothetical protein
LEEVLEEIPVLIEEMYRFSFFHIPFLSATTLLHIEERYFLCGPCRDIITRIVGAMSSVAVRVQRERERGSKKFEQGIRSSRFS